MWIIYTEIITDDGFERWYFGSYSDRDKANEMAMRLTQPDRGIYRCVCHEDDAENLGVRNFARN